MDEIHPTPPTPPEPPAFGEPVPPTPPPPPPAMPLPWEQPGYPFFAALYETTKLFLTRTREAFVRSSPTIGWGRPFFYGCLLAFILNISSAIYQFWMRTIFGGGEGPWKELLGGDMAIPPLALLAANVLLGPFVIPIGILIGAGLIHLSLLILGGAPSGFTGTLRATCYAHAPMVLGILPLCGFLVAPLWSLVLTVIGLTVIHRVSTGKAIAGVLLPCLICCACLAPIFFLSGVRRFFMHQ